MKRNVKQSLLWLLVGTMLVGCGNTSHTGEETKTVETTISETESVIKEKEPLYVEYGDEFFTWCDPEKKVYTSFQNVDKDIYARIHNRDHSFVIMTKEHVNLEEIEIIIPIESDYYVEIRENTNVRKTKYEKFLEINNGDINGNTSSDGVANAYPYILYHCYQDTDWSEMLQLYMAKEEAEKQQSEMLGDGTAYSDKIKYEDVKAMQEAYKLFLNQYREAYKALKSEDLPEFYYYEVEINFGLVEAHTSGIVKNESFEQIEIKIGEKTYKQDIGQIRIHADSVWDFKYSKPLYWEILQQPSTHMAAIGFESNGSNYPWGNCVATTQAFVFKPKEDVMITKSILFAGPSDLEILGARVRTEHPRKETVDFYWDMESPFFVEEKTIVCIDIFWKDPDLEKLEYSTMLGMALEYEVGDTTLLGTQYIEINRDECIWSIGKYSDYSEAEAIGESWFRYVTVFEGLNLKSYINDFYRPLNESWKEELPW